MKTLYTILITSFLLFSSGVSCEEIVKLHSVGTRWTQNLEGGGSELRLFTKLKILKNHRLMMGWTSQGLDTPGDIFNGSKRKDKFMTQYEFVFD